MKSYMFSMVLASLAVVSASDMTPGWSYALPDTGLLPSAFSYEFTSTMRERHNGLSRFGMQQASLTIPLSDPRQSSIHGWAFNASFESTVTFIDARGTLDLHSDTLYKFTLPLTFIKGTSSGGRILLAAAPAFASDLERAERSFDFGMLVAYMKPVNKSFNYTIGIAAYPRFARYWAVPFVGFEWKPAEDWKIALSGYRFSIMHAVTERFSAGAFVASRGGVWSVETDRGARQFSVQSLVVGVTGEYDFSQAGQRKRIITASLGSTLATSVRFHECSSSREADEAHHYRPGFYGSVGVDFRF